MKIINLFFLSLFFICTIFLEAKTIASDDLLKNIMPSLESSQIGSKNTIFFYNNAQYNYVGLKTRFSIETQNRFFC